MTYEQAREKIKELVQTVRIEGGTIEEWKVNGDVRDIFSILLTPQQIRAWKDGGELVVTDPDQSLPEILDIASPQDAKGKTKNQWFLDGQAMVGGLIYKTGFRKVVTQQSGPPQSEDEVFARGI